VAVRVGLVADEILMAVLLLAAWPVDGPVCRGSRLCRYFRASLEMRESGARNHNFVIPQIAFKEYGHIANVRLDVENIIQTASSKTHPKL
jgi:hypothetical protein